MSGRPRTTSFAEGNRQPPNLVLGGMKISSKYILCYLKTFIFHFYIVDFFFINNLYASDVYFA